MANISDLVSAVYDEFDLENGVPMITIGESSVKLFSFEDVPTNQPGSYVLFEVLTGPPSIYYGGEYRAVGQIIFVAVASSDDSFSINEVTDKVNETLSLKKLQYDRSPIYTTDVAYVEGITQDARYPTEVRKRVIVPFSYYG